MLLAEASPRRLAFIRAELSDCPLVPRLGLRDPMAARSFLAQFQDDTLFFPRALRAALGSSGAGSMVSERGLDGLMERVAQGIAARQIAVGSALPRGFQVVFFEAHPHGEPFDKVMFPTASVAEAFLAGLRADPAASGAVARAMQHEAGRVWLHAQPSGAPGEDAGTAARLLRQGLLLLEPLALDEFTFRLAWCRSLRPVDGAGGGAADTPPAGPATISFAAAPDLAPPLPRSVLPELPAVVLPDVAAQVAALTAASAQGLPFCAECAPSATLKAAL